MFGSRGYNKQQQEDKEMLKSKITAPLKMVVNLMRSVWLHMLHASNMKLAKKKTHCQQRENSGNVKLPCSHTFHFCPLPIVHLFLSFEHLAVMFNKMAMMEHLGLACRSWVWFHYNLGFGVQVSAFQLSRPSLSRLLLSMPHRLVYLHVQVLQEVNLTGNQVFLPFPSSCFLICSGFQGVTSSPNLNLLGPDSSWC